MRDDPTVTALYDTRASSTATRLNPTTWPGRATLTLPGFNSAQFPLRPLCGDEPITAEEEALAAGAPACVAAPEIARRAAARSPPPVSAECPRRLVGRLPRRILHRAPGTRCCAFSGKIPTVRSDYRFIQSAGDDG